MQHCIKLLFFVRIEHFRITHLIYEIGHHRYAKMRGNASSQKENDIL